MLKRRIEGEELQRLMEEQDLTQRELAEKAGVRDGVISLARRGRQPMSAESEQKVARALGVREPVSRAGVESYRAGTNSVRLVAGQSQAVAYPRYEESSSEDRAGEEKALGGDRSDLVSLAGLCNWRTFNHLSQSELSRRTGLNRATINQAEKKGRATRKTARLLAKALGVSEEELAEAEQKSRFPGRPQRSKTVYSEERTSSCSADSSPATEEEERSPLTVELSEPVLKRVDRFLDLLESALRPRRT